MMGSPFYYDVLFDDGPGDFVFHDCMWSGICTCCIQLLHQDSAYEQAAYIDQRVTKSPHDVKAPYLANSNNTINNNHHHHNYSAFGSPKNHLNISDHHHHQQYHQSQSEDAITIKSENVEAPYLANNNNNTNTTNNNHNHLNNSVCAATKESLEDLGSTSPDTASSSPSTISPKPIRRREHNDSERKRRDHLRNAFNSLRDQVPRFKSLNKKPPRIQILHEATSYVTKVIKESHDLERRLAEEKQRHDRLQNRVQNNIHLQQHR